ncbi:hypothetical protein CDIMF43_120037 [Carnobacterium divergens]|nr:hypothetical protein CDIMF43_120037 [Carnobacterium divergens]
MGNPLASEIPEFFQSLKKSKATIQKKEFKLYYYYYYVKSEETKKWLKINSKKVPKTR